MDRHDDIRELFQKHLRGTATPADQELLYELMGGVGHSELVDVLEPMVASTPRDPQFDPSQWEAEIQYILRNRPQKSFHPLLGAIRTIPRRWAAAAAILLLLSGSFYWFLGRQPKSTPVSRTQAFKNDIAPGGNKAILTLSNGQQIILDSAHNGQLASQGNTRIIKPDSGSLTYQFVRPLHNVEFTLAYNTLSTPRGGQYQLSLPDGTKVWLNAASSIRYPIAFTGPERRVELEGEAYFEVAKDKAKPFKINIGKGPELTVLGTAFNINAYSDEPAIRTTLVSGAVQLRNGILNKPVLLGPGQQASFDSRGAWSVSDHADLEQALAWKNGLFSFRGADIHAVMRQIARWYDVNLSFEKTSSETFYVKMSRNTPVSTVLRILETTGGVHFAIDGKKITVLP